MLQRRKLLLASAALAGGCTQAPVQEEAADTPAATPPHPPAPPGPDGHSGWHEVRLPGKAATSYRWEHKDGRKALAASAKASASMWRRRLDPAAPFPGMVSFSWWVKHLIADANLEQAERADAPVRVLFGFDGDHARLSPRNRLLFELAHALTGEPPPYATLMYVWAGQAPVESVVISRRTDRVRKIVLDSGPAELGRWRDHQRHLADDFRLAFGEAPGPLLSVAVMTDADNTGAAAQGWYGPLRLHTPG